MADAEVEGGLVVRDHRGGRPKALRERRKRWSEAVEARFLDRLAATCNVTLALEAVGFTAGTVYRRRRTDPGLATRWREALEAGYDRLEGRLIESAEAALSNAPADPGREFPDMTVAEAIKVLETYRRTVRENRTRVSFRRCEKPIEQVRASIARKLIAIGRADGPA